MITIAIDASTKSTGVAIFKDKQFVEANNYVNSNRSVLKRIKFMADSLEKEYKKTIELYPQEKIQIVMEQVLPDNLTKDEDQWIRNQATFKALFYLQAAIVLMFDYYDLEVELVGATTWRKWCGIKQGKANRDILKARDIEFIKKNYNLTVNDDIADAICIGHGKLNHEPEPAAFNWED